MNGLDFIRQPFNGDALARSEVKWQQLVGSEIQARVSQLERDTAERCRRKVENAVVSYCAVYRMGKTTLLTADGMNKDLNPNFSDNYYIPDEIYTNYWVDIPGVHIYNNERMLDFLLKVKRNKLSYNHIAFWIDEASQPPLMYARNSRDATQTEIVTSLWQMPKMRITFRYSENIGNSVDVQQRDATAYTIMPTRKINEDNREKFKIKFRVISGFELWYADMVYNYPALTQQYFDTNKPVI